jgi:hypothetical protein
VSKAADLTGGPGQRGWSAPFTQDQLAQLGDGTLTAQLTVGNAPVGVTRTIRRDTVAPAAPTATPGAGSYAGAQSVTLNGAEPGGEIRFTTNGTAPTASSTRYTGQISVDRDTTIRAIAVDAAGNVSGEAAFALRITAAPAPPVPPVPGLAVLGVSASSAGAATSLPSLAAPAVNLRVSRLQAPSRLTPSAARRRGLVASFVAPEAASYAEARLYRITAAGRRLVAKRVMATASGRRQVARFTTASVRRKLAAGRYVIEVRTGPSPARMGPATTVSLRIAR